MLKKVNGFGIKQSFYLVCLKPSISDIIGSSVVLTFTYVVLLYIIRPSCYYIIVIKYFEKLTQFHLKTY